MLIQVPRHGVVHLAAFAVRFVARPRLPDDVAPKLLDVGHLPTPIRRPADTHRGGSCSHRHRQVVARVLLNRRCGGVCADGGRLEALHHGELAVVVIVRLEADVELGAGEPVGRARLVRELEPEPDERGRLLVECPVCERDHVGGHA